MPEDKRTRNVEPKGGRRTLRIRVKVNASERHSARIMAAARGYPNLSEYIRALLAQDRLS